MSADDYARGFKDHCAHGQQGRCATCVEAFARVRADERAAVLSVTQLDVGRARARGFAAGIEAAAKAVEDCCEGLWQEEIGRCRAGRVRALAAIRALAASTVTVDTGTGPYRAGIGTEPMPIPQPDVPRGLRRCGHDWSPEHYCPKCLVAGGLCPRCEGLKVIHCGLCGGSGKAKP